MSTELSEDYARSGFNQRLGFGARPAVLVVDFVKAYLMKDNPLYAGVEPALAAATTLVEAAREADVPIIYTVVHYEDPAEGGPFFRKVQALSNFVGDTEAGEICDELAPREGDLVVSKKFASAFFGTGLKETLEDLDVDSVIVSGLSTSGCVRASSLDAIQSGFVPIVVREAVGDRAEGPHEAALFDLDAKYADVVGLDDVLEHLRTLGPRT